MGMMAAWQPRPVEPGGCGAEFVSLDESRSGLRFKVADVDVSVS